MGIIPLRLKEKLGNYQLDKIFVEHMDNDLNVRGAFDGLYKIASGVESKNLSAGEAAGIIKTMKEIDEVFRVIF